MKISELIKLLEDDLKMSGDIDVVMMACEHWSEEGRLVEIEQLGSYGDTTTGRRAVFFDCAECHDDAIREKHMFDGED